MLMERTDAYVESIINENEFLKKEVFEIKEVCKTLTQDINEIKETCKNLIISNKSLTEQLDTIKTDKWRRSFITAIQDYNDKHEIENDIKQPFKGQLYKLRKIRNGYSHFMDKNEDDNRTQDLKQRHLYNVLKKTLENKTVIKNVSPRLLAQLMSHMESINIPSITFTDDDNDVMEEIEMFWNTD